MCRLNSFGWLCVFVLSFATVAVPRAAAGEMYEFDKILDTTADFCVGGNTCDKALSIDEDGAIVAVVPPFSLPVFTDLSDFGIPLDDSGPFRHFSEPRFNIHGDAVIRGTYDDDSTTIFLWSDDQITTIADESGIFKTVSIGSINNLGEVLFGAFLDAQDGSSLYIWNDGIIESVVGTGDTIDGNTVLSVNIGLHALNDSGQIAFNVLFEDETRAVYRATPIPEPATWITLLIGTALLTLSMRRRRRRSSMNLH